MWQVAWHLLVVVVKQNMQKEETLGLHKANRVSDQSFLVWFPCTDLSCSSVVFLFLLGGKGVGKRVGIPETLLNKKKEQCEHIVELLRIKEKERKGKK